MPSTGCSSFVGRQGGRQEVRLAPGCTLGNTIHEIGHLVGLWHEQSREDRDTFVRIQFANIEPAAVHNFNQHITDGDDVGAYDYGSIMHYPRTAFSRNGQDTVVPLTAGVTIGQRTGLSAGDIAAANSMCAPVKTIVKETTAKEFTDEVVKPEFKERAKDFVKDGIKDRPKESSRRRSRTRQGLDQGPHQGPAEGVHQGARARTCSRTVPRRSSSRAPRASATRSSRFPGGHRPPGEPPRPRRPARSRSCSPRARSRAAAGRCAATRSCEQLLAVLAEYTRLDALGVLGPDDRTAWQQTATYAQQLLGETGR